MPAKPSEEKAAKNTDREIWRRIPDDYYSPSIHATKDGGIGINVGGLVHVRSIEEWHSMVSAIDADRQQIEKLIEQNIQLKIRVEEGAKIIIDQAAIFGELKKDAGIEDSLAEFLQQKEAQAATIERLKLDLRIAYRALGIDPATVDLRKRIAELEAENRRLRDENEEIYLRGKTEGMTLDSTKIMQAAVSLKNKHVCSEIVFDHGGSKIITCLYCQGIENMMVKLSQQALRPQEEEKKCEK